MSTTKDRVMKEVINNVISSKFLRDIAVKKMDKMLQKNIVDNTAIPALPAEKKQRYAYLSSIMHQVKRNLDKGYISAEVTRKMVDVFTDGGQMNTDRRKKLNPVKEAYKEKYGDFPPQFCVLSPTKACNLNCLGCYATSDQHSTPKLEFDIARKVVEDVHDTFGSRFMTISGGEPFMYKSQGKTMWDIWEEFNDMFFLVYTNATLMNEEVARRLAKLGNVTPCISVEGFEQHTDKRRGKGVHQKILKAFKHLQDAGVPYGISVTATSQNVDVLLTEDFYDYYFGLGITYLFQFQMMPVGRGKEVIELMITPQQRVDLYKIWKKLLMEKRYPIADFWNSGALTDGCLAYGRWGGYFYVNWHGNVMPCVFVPFYVDNVNKLYAEGKSLGDALQSKFFKNGRAWQIEHGCGKAHGKKNVLMPCSIKDHHDNFRANILTEDAKPENEDAEHMRSDPEFVEILRTYDAELEELSRCIFEEDYLERKKEEVTVTR